MMLALMIWNLTSPCAIVIVGVVFIGDTEEKEENFDDSLTDEEEVDQEEFNIYIKIKNIILNDANKNRDFKDYREKNYREKDSREKSNYVVSKPIPIPIPYK